MAGVEARNLDSPDETRNPDKGTVELVKMGEDRAGRFTFQPGWRWSESIKPTAGTDSCQSHHFGYVLSGALHIEHEDGTTGEATAGSVYRVEPGHDAWVIGDEPFIGIEFDKSIADYAKASGS